MSRLPNERRFDGLSSPVGRTTLEVERLPVFHVHRDNNEDPDASKALARVLFPAGFAVNSRAILPGLHRFTTANSSLDIYTNSRTIWFETDALWQFDLHHLAQRAVRTPPKISPLTDLMKLDALNLFPRSENGVQLHVETAWRRGTIVAVWHKGKRKDTVVNVSTSHTVKLELPKVGHVPVVGKGGKLGTAHDRNGVLCGLNVGWTRIDGKKGDYDVISQQQADAAFRDGADGAKDLTFRSRLAYRLVETYGAAFLAPCWVYDSTMSVSGRRMSRGAHMLPATTFESTLPPAPFRDDLGRFMVRGVSRAVSWPSTAGPRSLISWLGETGGALPHSRTTAGGIVDKLTAAGWTCRAFGDHDALQHDWLAKSDAGVESANLAWYVGHADGGSIELVPPDGNSLSCSEWSFGDPLHWIVVDACGPLRDKVSAEKGSIFDRWRPAFAGLHALLGFGTTQEPQGKQGPATLDLALAEPGPLPLARAWFRAVREHQTNRCSTGVPYVAGMFAVDKNGKSTIDDFLPGVGEALAGPLDKDTFTAVWMPLA